MAITAASTLSDFSGFLTRNQAQPIFDEVRRQSVVQSLARQVPLGINGEAIPVVTGKVTAGWVAEGAPKPASEGARTLVNMDPKKIAAIAVVSAEVLRANPAGYMDDIRGDIAEAIAIAFDAAALYGTASPFAADLADTTKSVEFTAAVYDNLVAALTLLVNDGKALTGWALGLKVEPLLLGAKDTAGRPIFIDAPPTETVVDNQLRGRMLGRPAILDEAADSGTNRGFAGDWSQIVWGQVGGITYDVSTEATVTINGELTSLWENNLVAIRAETEFGLVINDVAAFVEFTDAA
jgi:HK97 family phage major capsid protein